ncbi:ubiquitin carboxyl-terminal hydrolase-domain-containing protein [Pisolithus tinctorius]|nr:ubiquitin carboxyl-terminal hydrolase-domain-containing protein [Pisolithus tinctorius]
MVLYQPLPPITTLHDAGIQAVTALSFDPVSDSVWAGVDSGVVVALHTVQGLRGVSFPVGGGLAVKQITVGDNYVRAFGFAGEGIGSWAKGGMNKWYFRPTSAFTAASPSTFTPNLLATASSTPELTLLNASTGSTVRQAPVSSVITHLQFSLSNLLSASIDGYVRVHDPRTGIRRENGEGSVQAHSSGVQDLQVTGNFFFTVGRSIRRGHEFPDPLVKVYDLRSMRPLPPIPFSEGPAFINLVPKHSSSLVVTSAQGLVNVVDVSDATNISGFYQLETTAYITSVALSSSGSFIGFGDAAGDIHLLTAADESSELYFNGFEGQPIEHADVPEPLPDITWTDSTPLNSIGMPHYNTLLLSSWTPRFVSHGLHYPPLPKIPPQILSTMKVNDNIAYAALPKELRGRRNRVQVTNTKDQGRFRSGKSRRDDVDLENLSIDDSVEEVPRMYRKVEIEYSKFGVEDFDFGFYNKTSYSGLETHILNSYTNPILQVMHYTHPIRNLARSHTTTNCPREHCLLCELGFVVRMLEDAHGTNCQASNFCRVIGVLAQARNQLDLIDYGREAPYDQMIQSFHRFFVDHLSVEGNSFPHNPVVYQRDPYSSDTNSPAAAPVTQLLGIDAKNIVTCLNCKAVREKENMTHIIDMVYPRPMSPNEPQILTDFANIIRSSIIREMSHKATCQTCKQFATFISRRSISTADLPPILAINTSIYNEESMKFWFDTRHGSFLQSQIELQGEIDGVEDPEIATYELRAIVCQITTKTKQSHLVALIKVPPAHVYHAETGVNTKGPWYLFNDFVVRNISEEEALSFPSTWKKPSILYLERTDVRDRLDFRGLPDELDPSILSQDTSISINRDKSLIRHEPLRFEELPTPGTLVAIDAEFVSMQQEEIEYRSDRTSRVLRPARLSLARVSVLRGDGPKEGVPFIDDHIHTSEAIVDYLTEFSGIKYGDLDPHLSPFTLTPLKLVYKKLRLLVDRGCIFVGHGLSKDFRIINIYVPPEQVIDTVDLYFISSRQRRLSLRYLAWYILGENIQTDTHDSIEDANSALRLYKAYQDMEERGAFDEKLEELYREGRQYNFKPPASAGASTSPSKPQTSGPPTQAPSPAPQLNLSPSNFNQQQQFTRMNANFYSLPDMSRFAGGRDWNRNR